MSITQPASDHEFDVFRQLATTVDRVFNINVEGVTHEESLVQPQPAGNCLNWVVGHLVWAHSGLLGVLGQEPVFTAEALKRYERGSSPMIAPAEAMPLDVLVDGWRKIVPRVDAGIGSLTVEQLDGPAPFSPQNNPKETVRSLLTTMFFHQSYHAGQTGVLRRVSGKPGAIK